MIANIITTRVVTIFYDVDSNYKEVDISGNKMDHNQNILSEYWHSIFPAEYADAMDQQVSNIRKSRYHHYSVSVRLWNLTDERHRMFNEYIKSEYRDKKDVDLSFNGMKRIFCQFAMKHLITGDIVYSQSDNDMSGNFSEYKTVSGSEENYEDFRNNKKILYIGILEELYKSYPFPAEKWKEIETILSGMFVSNEKTFRFIEV